MAKLASTDDLAAYALRKLGSPVINIAVDDTQMEDRIDDAMQLFTQRHYNGYDEVFIAHFVSATEASNGYVVLPENISAVTEIYSLQGQDTSVEAFDRLTYRLANSDIFDFLTSGGGGLVDYYMTQSHINLIHEIFTPKRTFSFNGITHRFATAEPLIEGTTLAYKAYQVLEPEDFEDVYNNEWVKKYATALVKQQWGTNLKKFDGVQLPGGITLNGQNIWDEATAEITRLEEEFSLTYELPLDMTWA